MKKILKPIFLFLLLMLIIALLYVAITFPTVMGGMGAKTMCSCVFVAGRTPESVKEKELTVFPGLASARFDINTTDSTVTTSILWHTSKAIFRKSLGCTLLSERSEQEVRSQKIHLATKPFVNQDTVAWPFGDKLDSLPKNINMTLVNQAVDSAFVDIDTRKPVYTNAVVVVYDGKIIAEKYAEGFDRRSLMMGWSMTKSIGNAYVGLLVKEGKLKIDDHAPVAEWQNDERKDITINDLLHASSGLKWSESYFIPTSTFHNMFIRSDDKGAYAASMKLEHKPGKFFQYSSGTSNILSRIMYENLFYKIGMYSPVIEPDASGTFVMSSYCYATARDWARFGLLYLQDGVWNGERLLPEGWVKYTSTPAPAAPLQQYGAQWWLNVGDPKNPSHVEYPGLPNESVMAEGFERQLVLLLPSKGLVIVRLGITHNGNFSAAKLVNGVIKGLPQ
jgi:CubicO group peptidase (beta-lactamase class C family)